jgi:hypothetical protein
MPMDMGEQTLEIDASSRLSAISEYKAFGVYFSRYLDFALAGPSTTFTTKHFCR